jgi:hypothetical protein
MRNQLLLVLGLLAGTACSGADAQSISNGDNSDPAGEPAGGDGADQGGDPGASDGGTSKGDASTPKPGEPAHLATGLTITEVAIFQAVKISLVKQGTRIAQRNAPIVAGRDGLVRVYVAPVAGAATKPVTAVLTLTALDGTVFPALTDTKTLSAASTDAASASTFNFLVPKTSLPVGVKIAVALTDASAPVVASGVKNDARWPADGSSDVLGAANSGPQLKIVLVPVQYMADSSGRLPDTTPAQVERYRQMMNALYPVANVDISVHAPLQWTKAISANGTGFGTVLQGIINLRETDGAADDVYYWGSFTPGATFSSYCQGSCVTGLSGVLNDPRDSTARASVGVGFSGDSSASTMAHELGHAHGRSHSPCGGASNTDPQFPYAGGTIGSWGYDLRTKALVSPSTGKDMMGYCTPEWISDYTYSALFDRVRYVNNAKSIMTQQIDFATPFAAPKAAYRFVEVAADGSLSWGEPVALRAQPYAEPHEVTFEASNGAPVSTATAHYYKYDHLPGGFLIVPEGPSQFARMSVKTLGTRATTTLSR